jgi:hypothetical protein
MCALLVFCQPLQSFRPLSESNESEVLAFFVAFHTTVDALYPLIQQNTILSSNAGENAITELIVNFAVRRQVVKSIASFTCEWEDTATLLNCLSLFCYSEELSVTLP